MSEPKFTPGPWHVPEHPHADDAELFDVHWLPDPGDGLCSPLIREGLKLADARLIAAAPEMYEALRWSQAMLEVMRQSVPADALKSFDRGLADIRAALKKAGAL